MNELNQESFEALSSANPHQRLYDVLTAETTKIETEQGYRGPLVLTAHTRDWEIGISINETLDFIIARMNQVQSMHIFKYQAVGQWEPLGKNTDITYLPLLAELAEEAEWESALG